MIRIRKGKVVLIEEEKEEITKARVLVENEEQKAINYNRLTGKIEVGDEVLLNTTAVAKRLGTGGTHFIMANLSINEKNVEISGHIMKLRYTPMQVKCLSVEEEESPFREKIVDFTSLKGTPVIVGTLHSMLPPAVLGIRETNQNLKIAYLMTDGAALPISFSNMVRELKEKNLLETTVTIGHAFGGDLEAVNIYSGLIAAKEAAKADIIIVTMGPGIVGTGTKWGFSGVEQGEIINAINILGGKALAIPRISFADQRDRHFGVSHHSLTVLGKIALTKAIVPLPELPEEKLNLIEKQLDDNNILGKHNLVYVDYDQAYQILRIMQDKYNLNVKTMGRTIEEEREFFLTACSAGIAAANLI